MWATQSLTHCLKAYCSKSIIVSILMSTPWPRLCISHNFRPRLCVGLTLAWTSHQPDAGHRLSISPVKDYVSPRTTSDHHNSSSSPASCSWFSTLFKSWFLVPHTHFQPSALWHTQNLPTSTRLATLLSSGLLWGMNDNDDLAEWHLALGIALRAVKYPPCYTKMMMMTWPHDMFSGLLWEQS